MGIFQAHTGAIGLTSTSYVSRTICIFKTTFILVYKVVYVPSSFLPKEAETMY